MKTSAAVLLALVHSASASISLTSDNWDIETSGKSVFIKYFAPWCQYCKQLEPDWDKLSTHYQGSSDKLIAEVDCDGAGSELCDAHGIEGYPTIKYGDPTNMEEYEQQRGFYDMKRFAEANLKPVCSPANLDLCDAEKRAEIEKLQKMDVADLKKLIKELDDELEAAGDAMQEAQNAIEEEYQKLEEDKNAKVEAIQGSGLMTMKAVYAAKQEEAADGTKEEL